MSIDYIAAEDELFGIVNRAWTQAINAETFSYSPQLVFPGAIQPPPSKDQIYAECSFVVVMEKQVSLAQQNGASLYDSTGLLTTQIYADKADGPALRVIKTMGEVMRDAFRKPSTSGEIWFRDQKLTPVTGNATKHQLNVVVTCTYRTLK